MKNKDYLEFYNKYIKLSEKQKIAIIKKQGGYKVLEKIMLGFFISENNKKYEENKISNK